MFDKADLTSEGVTIPDPIDVAERDGADLAKQLADLQAGRARAFFYPNGAFDWTPMFRLSHLADVFIYADSRFTEKRFEQAYEAIRKRQTQVGDGLQGLQMGDPLYTDTLEQEIPLVEAQESPGWIWEGTQPVKPWVSAKLMGRNIGRCKRRLWLIYVGGANPLTAYEALFAQRRIAPRCLCLQLLVDVDTPQEAMATYPQRNFAWLNAARHEGPLGQFIRKYRAPLPEFLVGDCEHFGYGWPLRDIRQRLPKWGTEFGSTVRQLAGGRWPDLPPANEPGQRRVIVTLKPLNPHSAKRADAVVISPSLYRRYEWPEHLTVILKRPPQGAEEAVPDSPRILVREIADKSLPVALQLIEQVAAERNLSCVAMTPCGFEDEGEYLREWRRFAGAFKTLTIHVPDNGSFLDFAPYADGCD